MKNIKRFTDAPMFEITQWLRSELAAGVKSVEFEVLNPDSFESTYAGKCVEIAGKTYIYRGYKAWTDLSELLFCRMLTPRVIDEESVVIRFERLDVEDSFHLAKEYKKEEKYGTDSIFFEINKNEEPAFMVPFYHALKNVRIQNRQHVLDLGVNSGDEFSLIKKMLSEEEFQKIEFFGIDYSASAIAFAKKRFPEQNVTFIEHDINKLDELDLKKSDLIISIGTFQSPGIDFKPFFMSLVQNYLSEDAAIILGFPNCRWIGGEMIYGAKVPNYSFSEMGMLYSDVMFCKKYLQQKKFRVTLTGKDYVFLTATKIGVAK